MNERPSEKSVRLAAGAACAFTLAALVEIVPSVIEPKERWPLLTGIGWAVVALIWWLVFFQWKRKLER